MVFLAPDSPFYQALSRQVRQDESFRDRPYLDCCGKAWRLCTCPVKGKLTVGHGHNMDAKPMSRRALDIQLEDDLADAIRAVQAYLPWSLELDDARFGVLANMAFNLGIHGLLGFRKMLVAMQAGAWKVAAAELLDSQYAQQVGNRARRLAEQLRDGEWRFQDA